MTEEQVAELQDIMSRLKALAAAVPIGTPISSPQKTLRRAAIVLEETCRSLLPKSA